MYVIHVHIEFARCKFDGVLMVPHNHKTVFFGDKPVHIKLAEIFFRGNRIAYCMPFRFAMLFIYI